MTIASIPSIPATQAPANAPRIVPESAEMIAPITVFNIAEHPEIRIDTNPSNVPRAPKHTAIGAEIQAVQMPAIVPTIELAMLPIVPPIEQAARIDTIKLIKAFNRLK